MQVTLAQQVEETPASCEPEAKWLVLAWVVPALAALLFFTRLGARALWSSEFRWAEIAREMLRSGDYFWPTINGHVYYDKPLGSYWLVLASTWITGGLGETAARLPCAVSALLAVVLLILLARRLYDLRTGVVAAFILATSFSFVFFARHASADVETITGELAALLLFLKNERRANGWWVLALWVVMALTSLTKGLLGFALPLLVIGVYATLSDGWSELARGLLGGSSLMARAGWLVRRHQWLFNWRSVPAIAIALTIYLLPFQVSRAVTGSGKGLEMVYRENVVRFFHPFDHRGPIYLYVYVIFALMAPWSVLLPAAFAHAHDHRRVAGAQAASDRFALTFFWATFLFYTLSGSRRSYYILPILPAAALLVTRLLASPWRDLSSWARRFFIAGYGLFAVAAVVGGIALISPAWLFHGDMGKLPDAPDRLIFAAMWLCTVAALFWTLKDFSLRRALVSLGVAAYASMAYIYIFAMPVADAYRGEKPFAYEVLKLLGPNNPELGLYRTVGPLFYLDPAKPLPEFDHSKDLANAVSRGLIKWVVVRRRDLPGTGMPAKILAAEASFPWEGPQQIRNKVVLARLYPDGEARANGSPGSSSAAPR